MIISNKHGLYKLPNDLRLKILGNYKRSGKSKTSSNYSLVPSLPPKIKVLLILAENRN